MHFETFAQSFSFFLWSTFILSILLGAIVNKTNFCTMGAVSDMVNMSDYSRFRAWLLAITTALLGVSLLAYFSVLNVDNTFPAYRSSKLIYLENILGGFLFGIGMTFASGCGNKTLIRIGAGNIKSIFVFIVIAVIAFYMSSPFPNSDKTLYSVLFYSWIEPLAVTLNSPQDIGAITAHLIASDKLQIFRLVSALLISGALLIYIFKSSHFRGFNDNLLSGIAIGLIIIGAWYISSNISIVDSDNRYSLAQYYEEWDMLAESEAGKPAVGRLLNAQSFTFINPIGQTYGFILEKFNPALLSFGLVAVFGVIFGSFLWSLISRSFRIEWFASLKDFINHLLGAVLMGFGGVLALGCTIGQGITGVSTLAVGSILSLVFIIFGSALTMKIQYYKIVYEDDASFFAALITALVDMKLLPASLRQLDAI